MKTMQGYNIFFSIILFISFSHVSGLMAQDTTCVGQQGKIRWFIYDDVPGNDLEDMYIDPSYPLSPTYDLDLYAIEITDNFNNLYGSIVKGFIKVTESGLYTFNVTGNNYASFYLSESTDPDSKSMIATTLGACNKEEHYVWPEQTSSPTNLSANTYYYFEMHHKEEMYGDHATVYWRTPFYEDTLWRVVNATYLYDYICQTICPAQGTPCDDGKALTINDVEDGFCNCAGEETNTPECIGRRGDVTAMIYDSISGSGLNSLYNAAKYPLEPDTALVLTEFRTPNSFGDQYGTLIKGYFKVPQSGNYHFNLTADDNTRFYLSDGPDTSHAILVAEVPGWSGRTEHYKYPEQTSPEIYLQSNKFYYAELHHKEGWGGDHTNVYWRTPFRPDTNWMLVQGHFLYGFDCELACIPEGTACNDHDPQTSNDQYDANCDCFGTPCGGPCNQGDDFVYTDNCAPTDGYSNATMDSWLSCEKTPNPNPNHDSSHWIMYDFGEVLKLERTHYWNYNVENETFKGAKTVLIDHSEDGNTWSSLGAFQWDEASGLNDYQGDSIPALDGILARYLLFTISESWNSDSCAGFSEILFDIRRCRAAGTECDDGDPLTLDDIYDDSCNCRGHRVDILNLCDTSILALHQDSIPSGYYSASESIISTTNLTIGQVVTFTAGQSIELNEDFEVVEGSVFYASIAPCILPAQTPEPEVMRNTIHLPDLPADEPISGSDLFYLSLDEDKRWLNIVFQLHSAREVELYIQNEKGTIMHRFLDKARLKKKQMYKKRIPAFSFLPGVYTIVLKTPNGVKHKRIVILEHEINNLD